VAREKRRAVNHLVNNGADSYNRRLQHAVRGSGGAQVKTGSVESADLARSVISIPHEAVTLAAITDIGPMRPHLSKLPRDQHP
jgi:hypothetical protein